MAATINADAYRVPPGINQETPMTNPKLETRRSRIAMTRKSRRIINEGVGCGLALEGISVADVARAKAL
jgi:hypothetical protein